MSIKEYKQVPQEQVIDHMINSYHSESKITTGLFKPLKFYNEILNLAKFSGFTEEGNILASPAYGIDEDGKKVFYSRGFDVNSCRLNDGRVVGFQLEALNDIDLTTNKERDEITLLYRNFHGDNIGSYGFYVNTEDEISRVEPIELISGVPIIDGLAKKVETHFVGKDLHIIDRHSIVCLLSYATKYGVVDNGRFSDKTSYDKNFGYPSGWFD